jgi:hypothetical protein
MLPIHQQRCHALAQVFNYIYEFNAISDLFVQDIDQITMMARTSGSLETHDLQLQILLNHAEHTYP